MRNLCSGGTVDLFCEIGVDLKGQRQTLFVLNVKVRTVMSFMAATVEYECSLAALLDDAADEERAVRSGRY